MILCIFCAIAIPTSIFQTLRDGKRLSGVERHRPVDGIGRPHGSLGALDPGRLRRRLDHRLSQVVQVVLDGGGRPGGVARGGGQRRRARLDRRGTREGARRPPLRRRVGAAQRLDGRRRCPFLGDGRRLLGGGGIGWKKR